ncbi:uncharacterized protein LOC124417064 [Gallus gallus]|uniref:gastrokine-1-like precursor n=1 Tax=Gallus gallus TaxID=9031 RepID=UPI000350703B|nr:gastrokine-1-like precursor [Gallus gallus]XP_046759449.1 uncharacterized protein LOC124417064 [Gallus gallus]XP_046787667.1 uncharacterized protein LOC124417064 [Gallus gallus]|eukprot:XP_004947607.1 uncharacterized protein LOC101751070 [Gallus gallus]
MKFAVVLALLGVLLAPTLAEENDRRANGEGPHLPPPHEEGARHPHFSLRDEGPHQPPSDESPHQPRLGENPHYLIRRGYPHLPHRPPHSAFPFHSRPYFGTHRFAIRPPMHPNNWQTVWDTKTGFIATKVLGKNTCIISKADTGFNGFEGATSPGFLPPIEHRYVISNNRLLNLYPYGARIQRLCSGVPTYFAFPSPASNFLEDDASCIRNMFRNMYLVYCNL